MRAKCLQKQQTFIVCAYKIEHILSGLEAPNDKQKNIITSDVRGSHMQKIL